MKYNKETIIRLSKESAQLGMPCSFTIEALKEKAGIIKLREAFEIDCSLIRGAINDLSRIVS